MRAWVIFMCADAAPWWLLDIPDLIRKPELVHQQSCPRHQMDALIKTDVKITDVEVRNTENRNDDDLKLDDVETKRNATIPSLPEMAVIDTQ